MGMKVRMVDHTQDVLNAMHGQVAYALDQTGKAILIYVDGYVPKDTGNLANSMGQYVDGNTLHVGTNVVYGKYVEYREELHHEPPTKAHYLRDSISDHIDEYRALMTAKLREDL